MHFGSDNQPGASARVLDMLVAANLGHTHGYGDDEWTARAEAALAEVFEREVEVFLVPTGTAANTLALACLVRPWQAILCHDQAHILVDESTGVELQSGGARPVGISGGAGKLTPELLASHLARAGSDATHNVLPGALSLSEVSELGLVYSPQELTGLADLAHRHGLKVHVDGARFANAVAASGASAADLSWRAGVDVMSLGATKNGCLAAEAIVFFTKGLAHELPFRRKRAGHLLSKGRLLGAQLVGWLQEGHWLDLARHANSQAALLARELTTLPGVRLAWPCEANEVFVIAPTALAAALRAAGATFYDWYWGALPPGVELGEHELLLRLVTSFASSDAHRDELLAAARAFFHRRHG